MGDPREREQGGRGRREPFSGTLDSGWLHMELTYDPAASMVSGRMMDTAIAAVPVSLATPIGYLGLRRSTVGTS